MKPPVPKLTGEGQAGPEEPRPSKRRQQQDLSGQVLNSRFSLVQVIGSGGTGVVYRALDKTLDRDVAVKVLDLKFDPAQDPGHKERFHNEAALTARLVHPNIITVFDRGETEGGLQYIAMELLKGRTLQDTLGNESPFGWTRAVDIGTQICRALREAHSFGLVHRDLKPANVFLIDQFDSELVKVLDFGLAKPFVAAQKQEELTKTGVVFGSPTYMAPEQARNQTSPQSDIYSLGVVLFAMLTGRVPFSAKSAIDVIVQHVQAPVPWFKDVGAEVNVPRDLELVVRRCLEKEPRNRFSSMAAVLEGLKRAGGMSMATGIFPRPKLPSSDGVASATSEGTASAASRFGMPAVATPTGLPRPSSPPPPPPSGPVTAPAPQAPPVAPPVPPAVPKALTPSPLARPSAPVPPGAPVITAELIASAPLANEETRPYPASMPLPSEAKDPSAIPPPEALFSNLQRAPSSGVRLPWIIAAVSALVVLGFVGWQLLNRPRPDAPAPNPESAEAPKPAPAPPPPAPLPAPAEVAKDKPVRFRVNSVPAGATLRVAGKVVGTTPATFEQMPDAEGIAVANITLELEGYQTMSFESGGYGPEVVMVQRLQKGRGRVVLPAQVAPRPRPPPVEKPPEPVAPEPTPAAPAPTTPAAAVEPVKDAPPTVQVVVPVGGELPPAEPAPAPRTGPLVLTDAMKRPEMIDSGQPPVFTREAMIARSDGTAIAKCVVTLAGALEHCRIIKSVPFMDEAVLTSLKTRRYKPAELDGKPVEVELAVTVRFSLKR